MPGSDDVTPPLSAPADTASAPAQPTTAGPTAASPTADATPPAPQPDAAASPDAPKPGKKADKKDKDEKKQEIDPADEIRKKAKKSDMGQAAGEMSGWAKSMMGMAAEMAQVGKEIHDMTLKKPLDALSEKAGKAWDDFRAGKKEEAEQKPAAMSPPASTTATPDALSTRSAAQMDGLSAATQPDSSPSASPDLDATPPKVAPK
ncbi:hypothetical protein [Legionella nagasakiensis]|uniref:hypothetical protein n=1 Tax=Legionella nagasakiensis TaxID=535290 RepID=UPI001054CBDD|nr:hypothetical protein [Legionella nagasakiensis]